MAKAKLMAKVRIIILKISLKIGIWEKTSEIGAKEPLFLVEIFTKILISLSSTKSIGEKRF